MTYIVQSWSSAKCLPYYPYFPCYPYYSICIIHYQLSIIHTWVLLYSLSKWTLSIIHTLSTLHHRFQVSIPWCGVIVQIVEVDIIHALKKRWLMLKLNLFSRIKRHNHHFFCVMANTRNIILWEGQCG